MARDASLKARPTEDERVAWDAAAARESCSTSEFVRRAANERASLGPRRAEPQIAEGECPRKRFHRGGTFCKACGKTPAKL